MSVYSQPEMKEWRSSLPSFQIQSWSKEVASGQTSHDRTMIMRDKSLGEEGDCDSTDLNMSQEYIQFNLIQWGRRSSGYYYRVMNLPLKQALNMCW